MDYILNTEKVQKQYGFGDNTVHALKATTIGFRKGEFAAIIGPSGSGKSTLLHILSALDRPSNGMVYYDNKNLTYLDDNTLSKIRRSKFGFIFQAFNLIPILTVMENILLPVLLDDVKEDKEYIDNIVHQLKLEDRLTHLPGAISGGQQQRVAIARALANKPDIIFADEPTGNLDSKTSNDVMDLLCMLQKKYQQTLIIVTHDKSIAERADRIIEIVDGKIISDSGR